MKGAWALVLACLVPGVAGAQSPAKPPGTNGVKSGGKRPGTVLTFYGVRKLEQDPAVTDEVKMREWQAFIERAEKQIVYAKKAIDRWKNAARERVIEQTGRADQDPKLKPEEKIKRWKEILKLYPKSPAARRARARVRHWVEVETKRLADDANAVEKSRRPKVERIQAWSKVLAWTNKGPEVRAARRRINALQTQLFQEAQSVDKIARVDNGTKLEAWKDVLSGKPTKVQKRVAQRRVAQLEALMSREQAKAP